MKKLYLFLLTFLLISKTQSSETDDALLGSPLPSAPEPKPRFARTVLEGKLEKVILANDEQGLREIIDKGANFSELTTRQDIPVLALPVKPGIAELLLQGKAPPFAVGPEGKCCLQTVISRDKSDPSVDSKKVIGLLATALAKREVGKEQIRAAKRAITAFGGEAAWKQELLGILNEAMPARRAVRIKYGRAVSLQQFVREYDKQELARNAVAAERTAARDDTLTTLEEQNRELLLKAKTLQYDITGLNLRLTELQERQALNSQIHELQTNMSKVSLQLAIVGATTTESAIKPLATGPTNSPGNPTGPLEDKRGPSIVCFEPAAKPKSTRRKTQGKATPNDFVIVSEETVEPVGEGWETIQY